MHSIHRLVEIAAIATKEQFSYNVPLIQVNRNELVSSVPLFYTLFSITTECKRSETFLVMELN